jgi:hypothetical protein
MGRLNMCIVWVQLNMGLVMGFYSWETSSLISASSTFLLSSDLCYLWVGLVDTHISIISEYTKATVYVWS